MKKSLHAILASSIIGLGTVGLATGALAADTNKSMLTVQPAQTVRHHHLHCQHMLMLMPIRHTAWHLGMHQDKKLSVADARTITQAALLMHNQHQLKVGDIKTRISRRGHKMYLISIVNPQQPKVIKTIMLNSSNGHIHPMYQ